LEWVKIEVRLWVAVWYGGLHWGPLGAHGKVWKASAPGAGESIGAVAVKVAWWLSMALGDCCITVRMRLGGVAESTAGAIGSVVQWLVLAGVLVGWVVMVVRFGIVAALMR